MNSIIEQIGLLGILPVAVVEDENSAEPLAMALESGGLPAIEVTFRTNAAGRAVERIAKHCPNMLLGAGTILSIDQARVARDAGAKFLVSPGFNPRVVEWCLANSIPIMPGVVTPTEIQYALETGLNVVKFFPAEASGGLNYLKAIAAPFNGLKFIPTGGIEEATLLSYLRFPQVLACGGSWMVSKELISAGRFDEISNSTKQAVITMLGLELRHVGMNTPGVDTAKAAADQIVKMLNLPTRDTPGSIFVGTSFEVLKRNYLGTYGHIAIATNFCDRAVNYFERLGLKFKEETRDVRDGKIHAIYFDLEIAGFAVHLLQV
jgi:2-dehydro-3-deoxyphosphogluconate aldolase/(4S)-4-hydroxy-2-oxoglutarate aldolase